MEMRRISAEPMEALSVAGADLLSLLAEPHVSVDGLQALLDLLPIPAGLATVGDDDSIGWIAGNAPLARIRERRRTRAPSSKFPERIRRQMMPDATGDVYEWQEGGLGGRHFQVHLQPFRPHPLIPQRVLVSMIDRTTEVESERSLRRGMLHDSLTGLPNRLAFEEAIDTLLQGENESAFAVLVLDLLRFSRINEGMGSLAGDELLITVAARLRSVLRPNDLLAQLAADEFAILVRLTDGPGDALHVARRLEESLAHPLRLSELEIKVDCAIGCVLSHDHARSAADVIRNGQFALKRAKRVGGLQIYEPGEAGRAHRRFSLETELRRAIEADALDMAFQPLVRLETQRVCGFEALARWDHPEWGAVPPTEFIPVAEESGLILPLGRWALDRAMRTLAEWDRRAGRVLPIYFSVNVSAVQLARDTVATTVREALLRHKIAGHRLTLELTESAIVGDPGRAASVLSGLKALDARIAMDDFGTGYSSLAYLQRLPIDVLKIDRQFVSAMFDDRDSTAIIRAILSLAAALGMTTIAEGIETPAAAQMLGALGATTGQGYHFARPLRSDAAFAHLMANLGERI